MERLFEHNEAPADTEEVTSESGAGSYAIIGMGATGGVLVESLSKIGFENVLLCGLPADIEMLQVSPDRMLYLQGQEPKTMQEGELLSANNQLKIFETMKSRLGSPERIFVCVGANEPLSAGSALVLLECAMALLKNSGYESSQRVGIFVAYPTAGEMQVGQVARDAKFLVEKLFELNQRRLFDPLFVGDRSNICSLLDGLSAPAEAPAEEHVEEQVAAELPLTEEQPKVFGSSIYEE